jgi:hypothetical protein
MFSSSRSKRIAIAAVISVIAVAIMSFVAVSSGSPRSQLLPAHRADGQYQSVHVAASAAAVKPGIRIAYVYGRRTVQPGEFFGAPLRCPSQFPHPVSGGFDSNSTKVVLTTNRPNPPFVTARMAKAWVVGVTNLDTSPANVMAVVACEQ